MFSGFWHHRFWLSALLAFRHAGLQQYFWRSLLRASGTNKLWQFLHFFRFILDIGAILLQPNVP
jgi:hypothetical protein